MRQQDKINQKSHQCIGLSERMQASSFSEIKKSEDFAGSSLIGLNTLGPS